MIELDETVWAHMVVWLESWYAHSACGQRGCYARIYWDTTSWYVQHGANPESRFLIPPDQALTVTERDLTAWTIAVHAYTDDVR